MSVEKASPERGGGTVADGGGVSRKSFPFVLSSPEVLRITKGISYSRQRLFFQCDTSFICEFICGDHNNIHHITDAAAATGEQPENSCPDFPCVEPVQPQTTKKIQSSSAVHLDF